MPNARPLASLDVRRAIVEWAARVLVSSDASGNAPRLEGYAPLWLSPRVFGGDEAMAWRFYAHSENWRVLLLSLVCYDLRDEAVTGGWPSLLDAITLWYDIRLVHSREWIDDERAGAIRRLAARVPPIRSAKARGALRELVDEQGSPQREVLRTRIFPEAVFLAVERANHPALPPRAYTEWLLEAARSEARRLLEQEYLTPIARDIHNRDRRQERRRKPTSRSFPEDKTAKKREVFSLENSHESKVFIPSFEASSQAKLDIIMLSRLASDQQRQMIALWRQDLSVGDIARQLGISRATVYEQLNRLGKKYRVPVVS